jgi:hypothetical protein
VRMAREEATVCVSLPLARSPLPTFHSLRILGVKRGGRKAVTKALPRVAQISAGGAAPGGRAPPPPPQVDTDRDASFHCQSSCTCVPPRQARPYIFHWRAPASASLGTGSGSRSPNLMLATGGSVGG